MNDLDIDITNMTKEELIAHRRKFLNYVPKETRWAMVDKIDKQLKVVRANRDK